MTYRIKKILVYLFVASVVYCLPVNALLHPGYISASAEEITTKAEESTAKKDKLKAVKLTRYDYGINMAKLKWNKSNDADGYIIYRSPQEKGKYKRIAKVDANTLRYKDATLIPNQIAFYKVKAFRTEEGNTKESEYSPVSNTIKTKGSVKRAEIKSAKSANSKVTIKWNSIPNATGYYIYVSGKKNGKYQLLTKVDATKNVYSYNVYKSVNRFFYIRAYQTYKKKTYKSTASEVSMVKIQYTASKVYSSGNVSLDKYIKNVLAACTTSSMSNVQKLRACYNWVKAHRYISRSTYTYPAVGATGWGNNHALYFFNNGGGNCYGFAGAFAVLARALGYNAVEKSGYIGFTRLYYGKTFRHGYVIIYDKGIPYYYDPEENMAYGYALYRVSKYNAYTNYY